MQWSWRTAVACFHKKQLRTSWFDYTDEGALGIIVRPLDRVGVYAPGGTAAYLIAPYDSSAGESRRSSGSLRPAHRWHNGAISPLILAAASIAGVDRVFQVGGAQAIAAIGVLTGLN